MGVLKQAEMGVPVAELIRRVGIPEQNLYRWKKLVQGAGNRPGQQFKQSAGRERRLEAVGGGVVLWENKRRVSSLPKTHLCKDAYEHDSALALCRLDCKLQDFKPSDGGQHQPTFGQPESIHGPQMASCVLLAASCAAGY
jgi:hypothetical protein